jgi:hypothetical protein
VIRFLRRGGVALVALALLAPVGAQSSLAAKGPPKFIDLDKVPKPKITGAEIIAGLEEYVDQFSMRQNGTPANEETADFLAKEAKKNGFKTRILDFEAGTPARTVNVVEAVKKGTKKPKEWIAFIAHYDIVEQTVQGAYDDGSGTNIMRFFGKAFSKLKTNRSIALLWFDAEEDGLLASQAYAEQLKKKGQKIVGAFGFDMVGIGYPTPYCMCIYHGPLPTDAAWAVPIIRYVNFDYLKFPEGDGAPGATQKWPIGAEPHVCICGPNIRNSDESNFAEQGYLTMRWTGMRTAADYPGYHQPWDTVQLMELVAGGRDVLEEATENTFLSAYYTAFVVDNL